MQTAKQCLVTAIFTHATYPTSLYFEFFHELFFEHEMSKMSYVGRFLFPTDGVDIEYIAEYEEHIREKENKSE